MLAKLTAEITADEKIKPGQVSTYYLRYEEIISSQKQITPLRTICSIIYVCHHFQISRIYNHNVKFTRPSNVIIFFNVTQA